jgi:hypothetical protein
MTAKKAGGGRGRPGQGASPFEPLGAEIVVVPEGVGGGGDVDGGPSPCPFCEAESRCCEHLLVAADRTLHLFRGEELHRQVRPAERRLDRAIAAFLIRLARLPAAWQRKAVSDVEPSRLRHALFGVLASRPVPSGDGLDPVLVGNVRWEYLEEILFQGRDTVGLPWDFEGGPGLASDGIDFWSSDPSRAAREAARLILEDAAAVDRLLP